MKITEDMVTVFNQTLENLGCSFKLQYDDKALGFGNPSCEIVPTSNMFINTDKSRISWKKQEIKSGF